MFTSALGTYLGAVTNQYTGASHASPGATTLEQSVVDWMTSLFGLPQGSGGVLLSGGSLGNQTALVAARDHFDGDFRDGIVYLSALAHHSLGKAAHLTGLAAGQLRALPVDDRLRLDIGALRRMIDDDRREGHEPMMIVATAGTTDVGSVDPLEECASVAANVGCWFHVDAAYGGFFQLTERGRAAFAGIERADSITIDAHKSLFAPFGVGGLLARDISTLVQSHGETSGSYMRDLPDLPHYFSLGPELTRPYRGLALWLPLQLHGISRYRAMLDLMLDLARDTSAALEQIDGISLVLQPELSIAAFRSDRGDDATQTILDSLLSSGEIHVSSTVVDDRLAVRLVFLSQRTTPMIAARAIELVHDAVVRI
jgi:aromatic-L-amino-acid decarboxylase